jgi:transketolase
MTEFADMRTIYGETLIKLGEENHDIVVVGADTTDSLKTKPFGKKFPNRFFNVGIAEANLITLAAGLAAEGKIPFASTYAAFLPGRCVDQIRNAIAYPSRNGQNGLNVKMVVSHGGLSVGADGGSHQQIEDIAIMRVIPNVKVFIPSDTVTVEKLVHLFAQVYGPCYMRLTRSKTPLIHSKEQEIKIGKGIVLRDGSDCTIVACGITVSMALEAAESLKQEGISVRVIDMFSIKPIDSELLEKAARETGGIVTCEEHNVMAGFGSAVAETISETYPVIVKRIGVKDQFGESARDSEIPLLLEKHGITSIHISNTVKAIRSQTR